MSRDGREQAMLFLESGEIFGDIAVFSGTTYPGTVAALEEVDVWAIPADDFFSVDQTISRAGLRVKRRARAVFGMRPQATFKGVVYAEDLRFGKAAAEEGAAVALSAAHIQQARGLRQAQEIQGEGVGAGGASHG